MSRKVLVGALIVIGFILYTKYVYGKGLADGVRATTK